MMGDSSNSPQQKIELHDKLYALAVTATINPLFYYFISREHNGWKIAGATLTGTALGMILVKPMLYIMDVAKDLMGYQTMQEARTKRGIPKELSKYKYINKIQANIREKSLQFEDWLSKQSTKTKKAGLALLIAGSVLATSSVYAVSSYYTQDNHQTIGVTVR